MSAKQRAFYTLLSALVLSAYLFLGALLFIWIEGPNQGKTPRSVALEEIIYSLERLQPFLNNSASSEVRNRSGQVILEHATNLAIELELFEERHQIPWDLATGVHFCMTAVTTIGYGYLTPVTQLGRAVTIPYILFGIPINIFLSANLGYFVAHAILVLYMKISRCYQLVCHSGGSARKDRRPEPCVLPTATNRGGVERGEDYGIPTVKMPEQVQATSYTNGAYSEAEAVDGHGQGSYDCINAQYAESSFGTTSCSSNNGRSKQRSTRSPEPQANTESEEDVGFYICPFWFVFLILAAFCTMCALAVRLDEHTHLTFVDSLYLVIVTFTTVGFGDLKSEIIDSSNDAEYDLLEEVSSYLLMELGLIVMAATITLLSKNVERSAGRAKRFLTQQFPS